MYPLVDGRSGGNLPHPRFDQTCYRNMLRRTLPLLAASAALCAQGQTSSPVTLQLQQMANGLTRITDISHCGDERLFLTLQPGTIRILDGNGALLPSPFLDITGPVNNNGNEQGLLGLAFDPNYATNGYFYVHYTGGTGNGSSVISRFSVSTANPNVADPASEDTLFIWPQPYSNHNGGDLDFGPDGYLYVGFGDGGSAGDPLGNAQDLTDPLGDIIRIDVSDPTVDYTIPPTNPHVGEGNGAMPEIWASGLRNPYRWGFDRLTGDLWIGDVGQNAVEEVDFWPAGDNSGPNFGWRCREGDIATPGIPQDPCGPAEDYVSPVAVFSHGSQGWCSVIGGHVYRGTWYPHHYGRYIFTDHCAGDFITFGEDFSLDTMLATETQGWSGIGEDLAGQLYIVNHNNGQMKKMYDPCPMDDPAITTDGDALTATEGDSYQWYLNGDTIDGATSQTYLAGVSGNYQVRVNFGSPCDLISDTLAFTVSAIKEGDQGRVAVFPQPAKDQVTLERAEVGAFWNVQLIDALGRTVHTTVWPIGLRQLVVPVGDLPAGSYVVRCQALDGYGNATTPLVIAR